MNDRLPSRAWPFALALVAIVACLCIVALALWQPCCCGAGAHPGPAASLLPGGALGPLGALPADPEADLPAIDRMLGEALRNAPPPAVPFVEPLAPPTPFNRPRRESTAVAEPNPAAVFVAGLIAIAALRERWRR